MSVFSLLSVSLLARPGREWWRLSLSDLLAGLLVVPLLLAEVVRDVPGHSLQLLLHGDDQLETRLGLPDVPSKYQQSLKGVETN